MTLRQKLDRLRTLSNSRIYGVQELEAVRKISQHNAQPGPTPLHLRGVVSTEEGFETPLSETEPVGFEFDLPARTVRWSAKKAKYHLKITTKGPAVIDIYDENQDALIVNQRRSMNTAVIEVNVANARIEASRSIVSLHVDRFVSRTEGTVIVGPFHGEGRITASAKGYGTWDVTVASEPHLSGHFAEDALSFTQSGPIYTGAQPERLGEPEFYEGNAQPWSALRRIPSDMTLSTGQDALSFYDAVVLGTRPYGYEEVEVDASRPQTNAEQWWAGTGEWQTMTGNKAPAFRLSAGLWTYVWGTASGPIVQAYDMRTGRKAQDTSVQDFYLISTQEPSEVEIEGVYAKHGMPVANATIQPGSYHRTKLYRYPNTYFIKAEGTGILREFEVEETSWFGPQHKEVTNTRRIDLANYSEAGDDSKTNMAANGRGLLVFNTRVS